VWKLVVLRHANWGEADRILTLYTRERGKVRAIAKGVRRIKSRKAGHLEPFTQVTLQLAKGRGPFHHYPGGNAGSLSAHPREPG